MPLTRAERALTEGRVRIERVEELAPKVGRWAVRVIVALCVANVLVQASLWVMQR